MRYADCIIKNNVLIRYEGNGGRVVIPEGVTGIKQKAFWYSKVSEVVFPESLIRIEDQAFYKCSELQAARLPKSVTELGYGVFGTCYSLREVTIP